MNPRLARVLVAYAVVSLGCQDSEFSGEKGALRLRFGLGGCTSVGASKGALANGGSNELIVGDPKKRTSLQIESSGPTIASSSTTQLTLKCPDTKCEETQGTMPIDARTTGDARFTFKDADGAEVDSLLLKVAEATTLTVVDQDDRAAATFPFSKGGQLQAKLRNANGEVFAKTPFTWSVEGEVLKPITSNDSVVALEANATGTSIVNVRFGELAASIEVKVSP